MIIVDVTNSLLRVSKFEQSCVRSCCRPAQLFSTKRKDSFSHVESPTSQGNTQACSLGVNTLHGNDRFFSKKLFNKIFV